MKTLVSRAALAALLATSLSGAFVALTPAAALAQVSPADPNYSYDTRGKTAPWGAHGGADAAFAQAAAPYAQARTGVTAARGVDPDPNVRLQLLRSEGIFDR